MEDDDVTTLSVKSFIKKIDGEITALTDRLVANGMGSPLEDNLLRGKILAFKKAKEILLNKKNIGLMTDTKIDLFTIDTEELIKIVSEDSFIKPLNYFFLLALPTIEERRKSGIILAQESIDKSSIGNNVGRIIGIGKTVGGATGAYEECKDLKIGDYVGYNPHAGLPIAHDNDTFVCIADEGMRTKINDIAKHTDGIFKTYNVRGVN